MGSRLQASLALLGVGLVVVLASSALPAPVAADSMCPPVTIDDFISDQAPSTTPPETTSTTPAPTTTPPETTVPDTTTPDTTTPDTTTPDTTTPDTTNPDTTIADTTTPPETTTPDTTTTTAPPSCDIPFVYPMLFPLLGGGGIGSPFGAPRDGGRRLHLGTDVFGPQLQPVVAVTDGTVTRIGDDQGISGYRIFIRHDDGWSTLYIHLNNDTAGTDDGAGIGIRPDIAVGDRVVAGQVIGWNGNSGNAAGTQWHIHFELHDPHGNPVDPEPSLRAARSAVQPALPGGPESFTGPLADVAWFDSDGGLPDHLSPLILLLSRGVPVWCDDWGVLACPDDPAVATDIAAWLAPIVGEVDIRPDAGDDELAHASDCAGTLSCLVAASAPLPCDDPADCPPPTLTEADLARAFAWDGMRRRFEDRTAAYEADPEANPDPSAWAPPPRAADLSPIDAYVALQKQGMCLALPDDRHPLTRAEAAQWLAERLMPSLAQCEPRRRAMLSIR